MGEEDTLKLELDISSNISSNISLRNITNDSKALIEQYLGSRYMDLWTLAVLNTIYIVIFISGLFGNICTCIVIARNRYMHTATNCYLFSLAISDVLILILGKYYCKCMTYKYVIVRELPESTL